MPAPVVQTKTLFFCDQVLPGREKEVREGREEGREGGKGGKEGREGRREGGKGGRGREGREGGKGGKGGREGREGGRYNGRMRSKTVFFSLTSNSFPPMGSNSWLLVSWSFFLLGLFALLTAGGSGSGVGLLQWRKGGADFLGSSFLAGNDGGSSPSGTYTT